MSNSGREDKEIERLPFNDALKKVWSAKPKHNKIFQAHSGFDGDPIGQDELVFAIQRTISVLRDSKIASQDDSIGQVKSIEHIPREVSAS